MFYYFVHTAVRLVGFQREVLTELSVHLSTLQLAVFDLQATRLPSHGEHLGEFLLSAEEPTDLFLYGCELQLLRNYRQHLLHILVAVTVVQELLSAQHEGPWMEGQTAPAPLVGYPLRNNFRSEEAVSRDGVYRHIVCQEQLVKSEHLLQPAFVFHHCSLLKFCIHFVVEFRNVEFAALYAVLLVDDVLQKRPQYFEVVGFVEKLPDEY